MAVPYYGDFAEDDTVNIPFNTFSSDDPSASVTITNLVDADIKVHKDAHVDQIVTDGATVVIDFDGITGNHMINIDTSVDAAYATGSEYQVRIEGTTVDGATINAWVGAFSIERAGGALARLETLITTVGAAGVGLTEAGGDGDHLTEAGGTGDQLTAINLPNQTMDITGNITGNLSGSVGSCAAATVSAIGANVITAASINADAITEAKIADNAIAGEHLNATACTKIIDDFETQSQADPTQFHVNVKEINGTAQTAGDVVALANSSAAWGLINSGMVFRGIASAGDTTHATIGGLAGQGAGAFVDATTPWYLYVFRDAGGAGAAPQGETRTISAYNNATGEFTVSAAFTAAIAAGDDCMAMSGRIAAIPDILADTAELQADWADGGRLDAIQDIIAADTTTDIPALIATAEGKIDTIQAVTDDWADGERLDLILDSILSMLDDARTEPGQGNPPVNADAMTKLDYLYKAWRNKKDNDGTTRNIYNDAGAVVDQKSTVAEAAGTVTVGEVVSGP